MSAIIFNGKDAKLLTGRDLLGSDGSVYGKGNEKSYTAGAARATYWGTSGAGITIVDDSTSADLPRPTTTATGLKITGVSGSTAYAYYRFVLDDADANTKLKVQFALKPVSGYVSNDFQVSVYSNTASDYTTGNTRLALSTDSSAVTGIPNLTGTFRTTFDAPAVTAKWIEVRIGLNGTNTHACVFSDLIVGPGTTVQGAAVTQWQSYTPIVANLGSGSTTTLTGQWRRVGESMEIIVQSVKDATAGTGTGILTWSIPTGYTINNTALPNPSLGATENVIGVASTYGINTGSQFDRTTQVYPASSTTVSVVKPATSSGYKGADWAGSAEFNLRFTVPIAEWAGSGTVNLAQSDLSYYYGTGGTWGTSSTVTTAQGPGGVLGGTTTPSGTFFRYTLPPTTPVPVGAVPQLQISSDQLHWRSTGSYDGSGLIVESLRNDGTNWIGAGVAVDSSGNLSVMFGKYANSATAGWTGTWYWRVVVGLPGQAVGFGVVQPGVSSGLVSASGVPGNATGNAIASGYVGETVTASFSALGLTTLAQDVSGSSLALTAGTWQIVLNINADYTTGTTQGNAGAVSVQCSTAGNSLVFIRSFFLKNSGSGVAAEMVGNLSGNTTVSISSPTTYKLRAFRTDTNGTGSASTYEYNHSLYAGAFFAVRIA